MTVLCRLVWVASKASLTDLAERSEATNPGDQKGAETPFLAAPRPKGGAAASIIIRLCYYDLIDRPPFLYHGVRSSGSQGGPQGVLNPGVLGLR